MSTTKFHVNQVSNFYQPNFIFSLNANFILCTCYTRNGNLLKSRVSEICVKRIRVNKGRIDRYLDKPVVLDFRTLWLTRISLTHKIFFHFFSSLRPLCGRATLLIYVFPEVHLQFFGASKLSLDFFFSNFSCMFLNPNIFFPS